MSGEVQRFRKKPVEVNVRQFVQPVDIGDLAAWCGGTWYFEADGSGRQYILIPTLEGSMRADPGDWIIQGVAGEFHLCKPDIFELTYEPAARGGDHG